MAQRKTLIGHVKGDQGKSLELCGIWASGKDYHNDDKQIDIVTYNGQTYGCTLTHTSGEAVNPETGINWQLLSERGAQGIQGIQGIQGEKGDMDQEIVDQWGIVGQAGATTTLNTLLEKIAYVLKKETADKTDLTNGNVSRVTTSDLGDATTPIYLENGYLRQGTPLKTVAVTGSYDDLDDLPKIPSKVSELQNDSGFTDNIGTVTGIKMNGTSVGTSGEVDLGTVLTTHQDVSGKVNKTDVLPTLDDCVGATDTQLPASGAAVSELKTIVDAIPSGGGGGITVEYKVLTTDSNGAIWIGSKPGYVPVYVMNSSMGTSWAFSQIGWLNNQSAWGVKFINLNGSAVANKSVAMNIYWAKI